jgi:hypothetical protein
MLKTEAAKEFPCKFIRNAPGVNAIETEDPKNYGTI